jgi:hypothetical protein
MFKPCCRQSLLFFIIQRIKSDPDWLLASGLKVLDVVVKDNTSPGKQHRFGQAN